MDRISINLLPPELSKVKKKNIKEELVIKSSLFVLVAMVIATSVLFSLVVASGQELKKQTASEEDFKAKLNQFKEQESLALLLKGRLGTINTLIQKENPQVKAFNIVNRLKPDGIKILTLNTDKGNLATFQGETSSPQSLQDLLNNLSDPSIHENKVKSTNVESLNYNANRKVIFNLQISLNI